MLGKMPSFTTATKRVKACEVTDLDPMLILPEGNVIIESIERNDATRQIVFHCEGEHGPVRVAKYPNESVRVRAI